MSNDRRSSGQLTTEARFVPGEGWVGEVWTWGGELRHTTPAFKDKPAALQAAIEWRKQQKEVMRR